MGNASRQVVDFDGRTAWRVRGQCRRRATDGSWGDLPRRTEPYRTHETVAPHRDLNLTMIRNGIGSSTGSAAAIA